MYCQCSYMASICGTHQIVMFLEQLMICCFYSIKMQWNHKLFAFNLLTYDIMSQFIYLSQSPTHTRDLCLGLGKQSNISTILRKSYGITIALDPPYDMESLCHKPPYYMESLLS